MGQSNASNGAKDIDAFNEGNLDGVNIAPGEGGRWLHPKIKEAIKKEHEKEMERRRKEKEEKEKNKKNRKK